MQIKIEEHTLMRANERGASKDEIIKTINNGKFINAKLNRLAKSMIFTFNNFRNGKYYQQKTNRSFLRN